MKGNELYQAARINIPQTMIKQGVKLSGLQPQMLIAYDVVKDVFAGYGQGIVITSGSDGKHAGKNSKHYIGFALDFRNRDMTSEYARKKSADEVTKRLGDEFYVLLHLTHLHVQYNGSVNLL